MLLPLLFILAYLIGSIPFAIISSRLLGLSDPRQYGSGNPGASNVLRSGSRTAAALTLLGDLLKGVVVVVFAKVLGLGIEQASLIGFGAFLGHIYSIFLDFKGGKGVATALGILAGIHIFIAAVALLVWLLIFASTRYSSLAAILAAIAAPIAAVFFVGNPGVVAIIVIMSLLLLWRHRSNIHKLLNGSENRFGQNKS